MKKSFRINYAMAVVLIVTALTLPVSCNKGTEINLKDFPKRMPGAWEMKSSGEIAAQRGITEMAEPPDGNSCYGIEYDANDFYGDPLHTLIITHDGGESWHTETIPGLENNVLYGVAATTPNIVHVFGWNYVTGGGNVFRSNDGGKTWQREAPNAYTDPASFPDNVRFFNEKDGVIFGDPENGYYEIYTTHDGGNTWSRVPSNKIPAPLPNEFGGTFLADTYGNTMWAMAIPQTQTSTTTARLLQSDDKGESWYVRSSSLPFTVFEGSIKFRNRNVGLYKNNGILYRTTDGGGTWTQVNYVGTWFSYDLDNVPGREGWWVSTGGDTNLPTLSGKGIGSSISYDDGNHWITIDTAVNHTCVDITSPTHGYSGGITTGKGGDGMFVYKAHD